MSMSSQSVHRVCADYHILVTYQGADADLATEVRGCGDERVTR